MLHCKTQPCPSKAGYNFPSIWKRRKVGKLSDMPSFQKAKNKRSNSKQIADRVLNFVYSQISVYLSAPERKVDRKSILLHFKTFSHFWQDENQRRNCKITCCRPFVNYKTTCFAYSMPNGMECGLKKVRKVYSTVLNRNTIVHAQNPQYCSGLLTFAVLTCLQTCLNGACGSHHASRGGSS